MARRRMLLAWVVLVLVSSSGLAQTTAGIDSTSPLLAIEQNRASVVQRIVSDWVDVLAALPAGRRMTREQLDEALMGLRSDRLLAASLAGSFTTIEALLADSRSEATAKRVAAKALGDANADLTYTPVTPCRLADTRVAGGALGANTARDFKVWVTSGGFTAQGGDAGNCNVPANPAAVVLNIAAVNIAALGNLIAYPSGGALPNTSVLNYQGGTFALSNGAIIPACVPDCTDQVTVKTNGAGVDVVIDVVGYFKPPSGAGPYFVNGGNTFGTIAALGTLDNFPLDIFVNNALSWQLRPDSAGLSPIVVGGYGSPINGNSVIGGASGAVIAGGGANGSTVLGTWNCFRPCRNRVTDAFGTVGGGAGNIAGDGAGTATDAAFATVGGGLGNTASGVLATVGGGTLNQAGGTGAAVGGGEQNQAAGADATVAGGLLNTAAGDQSFAAGTLARIPASAPGTFLWADRNGATLPENAHDSFYVVATNGIGLYTSAFDHGCVIVGAAASWTCTSDRATKSDFAGVEPRDVLARLVAMPISQWRWKGEEATVRHMGPVAQDFRAAFGLGYDDKTITQVDSEGVALAAIQGLNQVVQEKDARIAALEQQVSELQSLRSELATLRAMVGEMASAKENLSGR